MSQATTTAFDESDSDTLVYTSDSTDVCELTARHIAAIFKAIKEGKRKGYAQTSPQMRALIRRHFREA